MRSISLTSSLVAALAISACASHTSAIKPAPEQVPVEVAVAVATGCIASAGRPAVVIPLKAQMSEDTWAKLAPGAKAQAVKAQAGKHMNYGDKLAAATSACK